MCRGLWSCQKLPSTGNLMQARTEEINLTYGHLPIRFTCLQRVDSNELRAERHRMFWCPPNQSLKLTEPAVDDFAAREKIFKGKAMSAARIFYMELAAHRRSLAPVRYASLAAGVHCIKEIKMKD